MKYREGVVPPEAPPPAMYSPGTGLIQGWLNSSWGGDLFWERYSEKIKYALAKAFDRLGVKPPTKAEQVPQGIEPRVICGGDWMSPVEYYEARGACNTNCGRTLAGLSGHLQFSPQGLSNTGSDKKFKDLLKMAERDAMSGRRGDAQSKLAKAFQMARAAKGMSPIYYNNWLNAMRVVGLHSDRRQHRGPSYLSGVGDDYGVVFGGETRESVEGEFGTGGGKTWDEMDFLERVRFIWTRPYISPGGYVLNRVIPQPKTITIEGKSLEREDILPQTGIDVVDRYFWGSVVCSQTATSEDKFNTCFEKAHTGIKLARETNSLHPPSTRAHHDAVANEAYGTAVSLIQKNRSAWAGNPEMQAKAAETLVERRAAQASDIDYAPTDFSPTDTVKKESARLWKKLRDATLDLDLGPCLEGDFVGCVKAHPVLFTVGAGFLGLMTYAMYRRVSGR